MPIASHAEQESSARENENHKIILQVICSEATKIAVEKAKKERKSLWRTSSTVFGHVASDQVLQPLGHFAKLPSAASYPPIRTGDYVQQELKAIALKQSPQKS